MRRKTVFALMSMAMVLCLTSCTPTDSVTEFNSALELVKKQDYPAALDKAKKCVRMNREDTDAIKLQVLCAYCYESGELEQQTAQQNLKRMTTTKAKDDYEAFFLLGWSYFQAFNYKDAQQALTTSYNLMPKDKMSASPAYAHLLYMLGVCYAQSNLPQGLEYLKSLADLEPYKNWSEYYSSYAMLAYRLKRYQDAINWFKKAQMADKTQPQPYFNIAVIYDTIYNNPTHARLFYVNALAKYQGQGNSFYVKKIQNRLQTLGKKK